MSVTQQQAHQLATLAIDCRPHGAPRWDPAGVVAALGKVQHLALPEVVHALIRAAEDRTARTPAVITNLQSPHWRDRDPDRQRPRTTYDPALFCGDCGQPLAGHTGDHNPVRADLVRARSLLTPGDITAAEAHVDDCLFRMLKPHEVAAGMAFPADYIWGGTRRERVKLCGNAVTPPAARDLIAAVVESLGGAA